MQLSIAILTVTQSGCDHLSHSPAQQLRLSDSDARRFNLISSKPFDEVLAVT